MKRYGRERIRGATGQCARIPGLSLMQYICGKREMSQNRLFPLLLLYPCQHRLHSAAVFAATVGKRDVTDVLAVCLNWLKIGYYSTQL